MNGESFTKEPSIIEHKAYRDTWGVSFEERAAGKTHLDKYLLWFYETVVLLRELLADNGTIYVHIGQNVSHYTKAILDEVFGENQYLNQIIWKRQTAHSDIGQGAKHLGRLHDVIFLYTKGEDCTWNMQYTQYDQEYVDAFYRHIEEGTGRRYQLSDITAPGGAKGAKGNPYYEFLGVSRYWRFSTERMEELHKQGRIVQTSPGTVPRQKRYLDEMPGAPLQDIWTDIKPVQSQAAERVGYETQKPEALLERVLKLSTNEGDLVLDCFVGSGTTAVVAEKLNRRWIAADLGRFAIHTTRKRLLSLPEVKPFVVQNLGKYERQLWQAAEFGDQAEAQQRAYRRFVLDLYRAQTVSGHSWLHGVRAGRMVHVGAVDSPVSTGDITQIVSEFKRAVGTGRDAPKTNGVDVLGWDFAFEMNEVVRQQAAQANINLRFVRIPHDVLDKKAVEQGDVRFFELAALSVDVNKNKRAVTLTLTDFVIPPDDVPEDVQRAITNWTQWIDYWAVDWDNKGDAFHNQWQTYRTRKDRTLQKSAAHAYETPGEYTIVIKVIDILGNDTTKTVKVKVA